jgi:hypothetical protein
MWMANGIFRATAVVFSVHYCYGMPHLPLVHFYIYVTGVMLLDGAAIAAASSM